MTAQIISGTALAKEMKSAIAEQITQQVAKGARAPGLAVILVGSDPASEVYVSNKRKSCAEIGIYSKSYDLPEQTSEAELLTLIEQLNQDESIDGILVQLGLPNLIDSSLVIVGIVGVLDVVGFLRFFVGGLCESIA